MLLAEIWNYVQVYVLLVLFVFFVTDGPLSSRGLLSPTTTGQTQFKTSIHMFTMYMYRPVNTYLLVLDLMNIV